jgi:hypothetical protein
MQPNVPNIQFDPDTLARFQRAKARGVPDEVNYQRAAQYQASKAQTKGGGGLRPEAPLSDRFADLLPLIGGIGGSFLGSPILGGAAGAGLGTFAKQAIKGEDINVGEAGKEAALSAVGGVVGKGLGFVGGKLLPGVSKLASHSGKSLGVKAFRANSGQMTKFAQETGEDFGEFLARRSISGVDDVIKHADDLQSGFDKIALSKNLAVTGDDIITGFNNHITRLQQSILPADHEKAKVLVNIADNFIKQYGNGPYPASVITPLRREIDKSIKDFALDQAVKGPLNLTRDVLEESLRGAADNAGLSAGGQSFKQAGIELSKLYKALEIGERQANLGRGNLPTRLTSLLAGGVGGASAGVPGAVAAMGAAETINHPSTISAASKLLSKFGSATENIPGMSPTAQQALTRFGVGTGAAMGMGQEQPRQSFDPNQAIEGEIVGNQSGSMQNGMNEQDALRQVIAQVMFSKAKNVSDLKTAFELMQGPTTKPLAAEQQKMKANAQSGLAAINTVKTILSQDSFAPIKSKIPIVSGQSPYTAAAKEVADVYTRLRTGAALNVEEQEFYDSQLPQPFDSPETIEYKLSLFEDLFNRFAYGQTSAVPDFSGLMQ